MTHFLKVYLLPQVCYIYLVAEFDPELLLECIFLLANPHEATYTCTFSMRTESLKSWVFMKQQAGSMVPSMHLITTGRRQLKGIQFPERLSSARNLGTSSSASQNELDLERVWSSQQIFHCYSFHSHLKDINLFLWSCYSQDKNIHTALFNCSNLPVLHVGMSTCSKVLPKLWQHAPGLSTCTQYQASLLR